VQERLTAEAEASCQAEEPARSGGLGLLEASFALGPETSSTSARTPPTKTTWALRSSLPPRIRRARARSSMSEIRIALRRRQFGATV